MIIESAFLNAMSAAVKSSSWEKLNEERLRGIFLQKVYEQFQLLYLDKTKIFPQCPYGLAKRKLADIKVCLPNVQSSGDPLSQYGVKEDNWIEIKYLKGAGVSLKAVKNDILRLCFFIEELQGPIRKNTRYLLIVSNCLSIKKARKKDSIFKIFKSGYIRNIEIKSYNYRLKLDVYTREFTSLWKSGYKPFYCGYLIRIIGFKLIHNNKLIFSYSDEPGQRIDRNELNSLRSLADIFNNKIKNN